MLLFLRFALGELLSAFESSSSLIDGNEFSEKDSESDDSSNTLGSYKN